MAETEYIAPGLEPWDIVIVVLYFFIILGVGLYVSIFIVLDNRFARVRPQAMFKSNRGTVSGYFLAGRFMTWLPVGASLFASNIGSEHFIGLAGSGAAGGIGVGAFEFNAIILLQLLGWVFLPVYIAGGVSDSNSPTGGLTAVIYTDTLCTFLMVTGSLTVMGLGFSEIGGYSGLKEKYMMAVSNDTLYSNSSCGRPRDDAFVMLRDPINSDMPWAGFIFGQTIASIGIGALISIYLIVICFLSCKVIVQRALAAKSLSHAQGGCLMAGYIKILPLFTLVMPGMISRVLSPDRVACSVPAECMKICGSEVACTNIAYPELVLKLMPTGLRGLMMAVMMAALMSDLTSIFNSASTLFTIDVYSRFRTKASVRELMIVGRIMVAIMTGIGILWIPVVQSVQGGQLFIYIQAVSAYFAPPIAALYLIAILWTKATEKGAFWGMIVGFIIGAIRMILDFTYLAPRCGEEDTRPSIVAKVHYMYFALILFWITFITIVVISLFTEPMEEANVARLTWWTLHEKPSETDVMEEARDEEIEMQDIPEEDEEEEEEEEKVAGDEHEKDATEETPAVATRPKSHSFRHKPESKVKQFYSWFCGYDAETEEAKQAAHEQHERLAMITSLERDPYAETFLNINVIVILAIGLYLYIFFSI
ncbi:Sodium/myo-inositol cotransporter [Desmophyllum pertusum]|uniref:Sodium/myo-inositol cotransporter n=1 Tax=Desmophyllum pertusum TaxID=174260 RepID=A0A9X0D7Y8_9CNID|nr:Sodium/myo-inositol cotransporter [Desmophyllum pertusum]